jgi:hypothetical protein
MLTNFWEKKQMYLDLEGMVRDYFDCSVRDAACNVDGRGPYEY